MEVLLAGTTGATFCVFRLVTRFGCVVVGDGIGAAVVDGVDVVVGAAVVVGDGDGAVVVVDDPELDCDEYLLSTDVIVNAVSLPLRFLNFPTAVQFPGSEQDTELRLASGDDSF